MKILPTSFFDPIPSLKQWVRDTQELYAIEKKIKLDKKLLRENEISDNMYKFYEDPLNAPRKRKCCENYHCRKIVSHEYETEAFKGLCTRCGKRIAEAFLKRGGWSTKCQPQPAPGDAKCKVD